MRQAFLFFSDDGCAPGDKLLFRSLKLGTKRQLNGWLVERRTPFSDFPLNLKRHHNDMINQLIEALNLRRTDS